ncbi:MAG: NAD(+) synthase, partial [Verrucomicrobiota bacterium]
MNRIRVGAAALNQTPLDWTGNRNRIAQAIKMARDEGVTVLGFPELAITGYGCEDAFLSIGVADRAWDVLESLQSETKGMVVVIGLPVFLRGGLFNAAAMLVDGELQGLVAKQNLAGDGLHYEPRWFKPWPAGKIGKTERGGYPIGDLMFEIGDSKSGCVRIGLEICEDAWVPDPPGIKLAREGVDIIVNPSASHFAFGKQATRKGFILDNSRAFCCGYVYANLVGNEAGRAIYDGGCILASGGQLHAEGPRLKFDEVHVTSAVFDLRQIRTLQARMVSRDVDPESHRDLPFIPFEWPETEPELPNPALGAPLSKEIEFTRAVALGLFDYLRKSHSRGFVVSLSGGADSGAVACLVHLMLRIAREEIGDSEVKRRLGDWLGKKDRWESNLLTCVYQATRNSGEVTRNAAREVASALNADFHEWDIEELVEGYSSRIAQSIERDLSWEKDDIALQNIQARVRSPGIWMLTNVKGALLLSTSNRSEAAVGYATMDGDTSGGLSPIAGIDKAFLRNWLHWLETEG